MTIETGHLVWSELEEKLNEMNNKIFEGVDKSKLSDYEKRKMIFEYLCNNLEYDFDALTDMILNSRKLSINFDKILNMQPMEQYNEVSDFLKKENIPVENDVIFHMIRRIKAGEYKKGFSNIQSMIKLLEKGKGLCNSDSIIYKLLLEMNDIYSAVYICDNSEIRLHALNIVYDKENNSYSFDDISTYTAARVNMDVTSEMFFDYDLEYANNVLKQGFMPSIPNNAALFVKNGVPMENGKVFYKYSPELVNFQIGRTSNEWLKQFDLEVNDDELLPNNIVSLKNKSKSI